MTTLSPELERETVKEPAPQVMWRNWWRSTGYGRCVDCKRAIPGRGEIYGDCCSYPHPSREAAEIKAREDIAWTQSNLGCADEYLGAFPIGERP